MRHATLGQRVGEVEGRADDLAGAQRGQQFDVRQRAHRVGIEVCVFEAPRPLGQALLDEGQHRCRRVAEHGLARAVRQVNDAVTANEARDRQARRAAEGDETHGAAALS